MRKSLKILKIGTPLAVHAFLTNELDENELAKTALALSTEDKTIGQ